MVSIGAVGGISEGDYKTWTKKWESVLTVTPVGWDDTVDISIDDKNNLLYVISYNPSYFYDFAIYNLSDHSEVFHATGGYTQSNTYAPYKTGFQIGSAWFENGGISQSIQSYFLLGRNDGHTFEVWRKGSKLQTLDMDVDKDFVSNNYWGYSGFISATGKYLLLVLTDFTPSPDLTYFLLYKGV